MTKPVDLEGRLRARAIEKLQTELTQVFLRALGENHAMLTIDQNDKFSEFVTEIVEYNKKHIGDRSVMMFMETYDKLLVEFPHLGEA